MTADIQGICQPEFLPIKEAFLKGFDAGLEKGASVAVMREGEMVVDLWGGFANAKETRPWQEDTLAQIASTTKIMTTLCALMVIDQGKLDPDAPVVEYWPEFGKHGKDKVLVRHVFDHSAGVPGWSPPIPFSTVYDWDETIHTLEDQKLWWEPGTQRGYHAETFGFLAGELIRRVSGLTPGKFLRQEVTSKIDADFFIGIPESEVRRFAQMITNDELFQASLLEMGWDEGSIGARTMNCFLPPMWHDINCLINEIPGGNGIGNARSVAKIGSVLANGGELCGHRFLSPATIELALTELSYETDVVTGMKIRRGFGMGLNSDEFECPSERALHWGGKGGSVCVMDLASKTCFAYVMNNMLPGLRSDPRNEAMRFAYNEIVGS